MHKWILLQQQNVVNVINAYRNYRFRHKQMKPDYTKN